MMSNVTIFSSIRSIIVGDFREGFVNSYRPRGSSRSSELSFRTCSSFSGRARRGSRTRVRPATGEPRSIKFSREPCRDARGALNYNILRIQREDVLGLRQHVFWHLFQNVRKTVQCPIIEQFLFPRCVRAKRIERACVRPTRSYPSRVSRFEHGSFFVGSFAWISSM